MGHYLAPLITCPFRSSSASHRFEFLSVELDLCSRQEQGQSFKFCLSIVWMSVDIFHLLAMQYVLFQLYWALGGRFPPYTGDAQLCVRLRLGSWVYNVLTMKYWCFLWWGLAVQIFGRKV